MSFPAPEDSKTSRVWIDGCFDFAHHGHAGAMLQARQIGKELYVGVHSDEEILHNKGPTVMNLAERLSAVQACKWCTLPIGDAPYVTDPEFMDGFDCKYAVHGDDITTDANGEDCYKIVKDLGRFVVVKRTPSISTTDLVGRMLLMTKDHHLKTIDSKSYESFEKNVDDDYCHPLLTAESVERYNQYATDQSGLNPGSDVFVNLADSGDLKHFVKGTTVSSNFSFSSIYYLSGTFDLFHPGHIELLKSVHSLALENNAKVVVGVLDDYTASKYKGLNYPIMSLFERSLCVLQCRYVDSMVLGAPYINTKSYFSKLKATFGVDEIKVFHGPTIEIEFETQDNSAEPSDKNDVYRLERELGILQTVGAHKFDNITTESIVGRILDNRKAYEERQRKKGWKGEKEKKMEKEEKSKGG
ncbi:ethanolamine-phosphate cytidylyltransferase [Saccharomycopsis crataegensis]|uniref:ethanolamine-phosphate cytidylyltransferase n=1 Tax=Saccharomycopsis crataegensis TaxID=43959 RepID=A0AAV5QI48_9ASCO|nr:ethanolamine-phosphate cytidylyltransferase [Saccharomycopsis crataegensis]